MKDKIISILVSVVMVIIALYPMYSNLKSTVKGVNDVIAETNQSIALVKDEIAGWQEDINDLSSQVDSVKYELQSTINEGVSDTKDIIDNGLANTENMINEEIQSLKDEINKIKTNAVEDVKSKTLDLIPDIKF